MKSVSFGVSDLGLKRTLNEDSYLVSDELGLYLVADGMGGHRAGDVASCTAVQLIAEYLSSQLNSAEKDFPFGYDANLSDEDNVLLNAVLTANRHLCEMSKQNVEFSGMGTTVVGLFHRQDPARTGGVAHIVNIGDSRAYRIRGDEIVQLTTDHSWVSEQLQRNLITEDEARNHRWRNIITRALGNREDVEIDIEDHPIEPGDCFVLCTDGLSSMLTDGEIRDIVREVSDDLAEACRRLVVRANEKGGLDNITAVLVKFTE
jgi:serine/threonine protein phosphatase PrpC